MGHGGATEGAGHAIHLASDSVHVLAGAAWIGAFKGLLLLALRRSPSAGQNAALHAALRGFSGVGSALVATLVITGLINTWVLVGPAHAAALPTTLYGRLLLLNVLLFMAMVAFAGINRFRFTPGLGRLLEQGSPIERSIRMLRRTIMIEAGLGLTVLGVVAWLGTLAPPTAA